MHGPANIWPAHIAMVKTPMQPFLFSLPTTLSVFVCIKSLCHSWICAPMKPKVVVLILTIFFMRIFHPIYTAAAEHHLVLCQSSRLIREQILDLTQVLSDVEGPALDPGVQLLVIQGQVVVDEVDLAQLHNLNGHVERNGDQHLLDRN